jgi:hypothetical protein
MRTTVTIGDDLLRDLKQRARREGVSLTKIINRSLRFGLKAIHETDKPPKPFREKTFFMGAPKVNLDKALALAAALEDQEVREELVRRK